MDEKLGAHMINGKLVDLDNISIEDLKKLRNELKAKEKKLLNLIDKELELTEQEKDDYSEYDEKL